MMTYLIPMPLRIEVGKNKKLHTLNLNYYRNWHRYTETNIKKAYQALAIDRLRASNVKYIPKCRLDFKLFKKSHVQKDKSNFLSIHEKYFCDAMVKASILSDDSDKFIIEQAYLPSEIDRENPRVEITIIVLA